MQRPNITRLLQPFRLNRKLQAGAKSSHTHPGKLLVTSALSCGWHHWYALLSPFALISSPHACGNDLHVCQGRKCCMSNFSGLHMSMIASEKQEAGIMSGASCLHYTAMHVHNKKTGWSCISSIDCCHAGTSPAACMASSGLSWGGAAVRQVQSSMLAWSEDIHVQQFRALRPCDVPALSPSLIAASAVSMTECPSAQPLTYRLFHHCIWCSAYVYCAVSNQSSPSSTLHMWCPSTTSKS